MVTLCLPGGVLGAEGKAGGGPPAANPQHFLPHRRRHRNSNCKATGKGRRDGDSQMLGLIVQTVPMAALGWRLCGGLRVSRARRRGAAQEAALGGVGDRDGRPTALVM